MTTTERDRWSPEQYNRFHDERKQPFYDLAAMIQPRPGLRVIDLGCGTGEFTAELAERLPDSVVEGVDSSPAMLAQAAPRAAERVRFRKAEISALQDYSGFDLIFSNAALQWVPENETLLHRMLTTLPPGGQIAVQVPQNDSHPSHRLAHDVAREAPFRELLGGFVRETNALSLERYAEILYAHGVREQLCIEKIYGHEMASTRDVTEWVKGTMLTAYLSRLDTEGQAAFLAAYNERLLAALGEQQPYFYPFRRLLFWARRPE